MTWLVEGASSFLQGVVLQYLQSLLVASTDPSIYTQCCTCCSVCVVSLSCLCLLVCAAAVHQPPHARRHEVHRRAGCSQAHAGRRGESAAAAGAAMRCYELVNEYYNRHVCQQRGCIRPAQQANIAWQNLPYHNGRPCVRKLWGLCLWACLQGLGGYCACVA